MKKKCFNFKMFDFIASNGSISKTDINSIYALQEPNIVLMSSLPGRWVHDNMLVKV